MSGRVQPKTLVVYQDESGRDHLQSGCMVYATNWAENVLKQDCYDLNKVITAIVNLLVMESWN